MEIKSPSQGRPDGLGFWHPAMRPDSHQSIESKRDQEVQGNTSGNPGKGNSASDDGFNISGTNSFPEVPRLDQVRSSESHSLSYSQVEDGMKEDEGKEDEGKEEEGKETPKNNQDDLHSPRSSQNEVDFDTDGGFFADSSGNLEVNPCSPGDEEAKFEEGLPFMPSKSHEKILVDVQTQPQDQLSFPTNLFGMNGGDLGGFETDPTNPKDDSCFSEPQRLDRKTTTKVLSSLQLSANDTTRDALDYAGNPQSKAESPSSVVSQVFDERELQGPGFDGETPTTDKKIPEADLAAMWQAALDDDELLEDDESGLDPSSYFEDDGEGFLEEIRNQVAEETPANQIPAPISQPISEKHEDMRGFGHFDTEFTSQGPGSQTQYLPSFSQPQIDLSSRLITSQGATKAYHPLPQTPVDISHRSPPTTDLTAPSVQHQYSSNVQAFSRPRMLATAQSFSDKSKGGYTSPYDLPMELTRPKKRTHLQQMQAASDVRAPSHISPPPRTSSIYSGGIAPGVQSNTPAFTVPRENTLSAATDRLITSANVPDQALGFKSSVGSFFEQLPPTKPRPSSVRGIPTMSANQQNHLPEARLRHEPPRQNSYSQLPAPSSSRNSEAYQLLPPERLSLYAHNPYQEFTTQQPVINTRYSPAPVRPASTNHPGLFAHPPHRDPTSEVPANKTRYSPTPVRAASTNHQGSLSYSDPPAGRILRQGGSLSQRFDYIRPSDGRENDPLERWKGCPIFKFGFGGTIVSSFPKQIPRYPAGQAVPMIKCSPGGVNLHASKMVSQDEVVSSFPGPLKSKSKKKELLDWLQLRISQLAGSQIPIAVDSVLPDPRKRHEEKILLWELIRILVEHDGIVEGDSGAVSAVRSILSPELAYANINSASLYDSNKGLSGITKYDGPRRPSKPVDPEAMEALRKILLEGEGEKAVWYAVDQRLWPHAMLLASALDPKIWRQTLQEFIRQEVRPFGQNTESLASFYQTLAGNWEESVDELVPPSARAGLHIVSGDARLSPARNAIDGLDRWRETLILILSNRSQDDWKALLALGQLLLSYGRTEAAHACFIFSKSPGLFGGADDPQTSVALLGADHLQHPFDYCRDIDSILLTEIYEFASTVLASSTGKTLSPHLQSYKLYHALILAEYGHRSEAQQYCDAIVSVLKSTAKPSPYFHGLLYGTLEELVERLRQAPSDDSASWMSRPSMDKVSGSVWSRFNQFIAGDESDTGSAASGKVADHDLSGPFARVVGDSPNISQKASLSELYSSYPVTEPTPIEHPPNFRYAPTGRYTPRSSLEKAQTWSKQEPRKESQSAAVTPSIPHHQYQPRNNSSIGTYQDSSPILYKPLPENIGYPIYNPGYSPTPPSRREYRPNSTVEDNSPSPLVDELDRPKPPSSDEHRQDHNQGISEHEPSNFYEPPPQNFNMSSYEPPATNTYETSLINGYQPPYHTPDLPNGAESPEEQSPKKKSFMDDDGNDRRFDTTTKSNLEKDRKDREVDEAFQKAAEADAQKEPHPNQKKSWFGSWLGSKKDGDTLKHSQTNGPIRAKLGEESSFFYDDKLKKWINKKAGILSTSESPKPPPPKGGPSRVASSVANPPPLSAATPPNPTASSDLTPSVHSLASNTPPINIYQPIFPSAPPSPTRSVSSAAALPSSLSHHTSALLSPSISVGSPLAGPPSAPPSAPPSRPATGMSNASSIDDLIGAPQPRKGGTVRKGKKGRGYVDVMAK